MLLFCRSIFEEPDEERYNYEISMSSQKIPSGEKRLNVWRRHERKTSVRRALYGGI